MDFTLVQQTPFPMAQYVKQFVMKVLHYHKCLSQDARLMGLGKYLQPLIA
jgi:hypothetical protein